MRRKKFPYWLSILTILLAGTASWALYALINQGAKDILLKLNITNIYAQLSIVFVVILIIFLLLGFGAKKSFEKIVK